MRSEAEARKHMKRRRKRRREKAARAGDAAAHEPAAEADDSEATTAADELEPIQVSFHSAGSIPEAHNTLCACNDCATVSITFNFAVSTICKTLGLTAKSVTMLLQAVRSKHKIRAFVFSPAPKRGALAQLTLSLANNTIEVRCDTTDASGTNIFTLTEDIDFEVLQQVRI